ncbi:MAG TPA: amino acid adenylation domain-containing protein, partial [Puia sp.]|nr:amino acid adenylation domain-containing protein [Puia sp.]
MSNSLLDLKALEANRNIVARNYWRDRLKGMEPASYFAHGQPPKASPASRHYGVCRVVASDEVYQTLCAVAPTDKARHMVLLAGLVILAAKYASAEKVCVFTPGYPGQEETLLIPFLAEDMNRFSFRDFLHTLKERLSADLKYGAYPLEKILATGGWTPAGVPVTGMLVEEFQASGVFDRLSPDILFSFGVSDRLSLRIRYDRNKYEDAPVTQLLHLYLSLLHRLIIGKATRIGEIGLASRDDEERILHQLNDTERNFPLDDPLTEIFRRRAESSGELPAVESADGHLNFRQLEEASNRLANYLAGDGLGAGEIIALRMERSIDLVVSILAVLKAGCLYLPIDPHYPEHRIRYMLEDSLAQRVLTKESLDEARDRIASCSPLLTEKKSHRWLYVFYTSGSTGRPKGVIGSQKGFINRLRWGWENYPYSDGEAACMKTSIGFVDHFAEIFSPLLQGIPLVIFGEEEILDPARMIAWLSEKRISRITLVPSLLRTLIALIREKNLRIGCLRYVFCSGEALPYSLGKEFYETFGEAVLINVYGSTEVSADATWFETDRAFFAGQDRGYLKRVPIGRPMSNVQVAIVDRTGMLLPPGVAGEILVGGDCVSPGYLNGPELTAAKMIDVPFFKQPGAYLSGDMGRWLANGDIEYLGRIDYQVKIRGIRIRLDEVEQVLVRCPGIGQAAVAVHGKEEDSFLVAY